VEHGIKISREFENHLQGKKLTQLYWARWYAEYIVEQIYPHAAIKERGAAHHVGTAGKATRKERSLKSKSEYWKSMVTG
jgi:hypothetical protein